MQSTQRFARSIFSAVFSIRSVVAAAVILGMGLAAAPADAGRKDRAGFQETRRVEIAIKRIRAIERTAVRQIERAPSGTVRLLEALGNRGATSQTLEAVGLRGTQKVAILKQRLSDQVRAYTDGVFQSSSMFTDEDGMGLIRGIEDVSQGVLEYMKTSLVSEELLLEVIMVRQQTLLAIEDAALEAQFQINDAIDQALAP